MLSTRLRSSGLTAAALIALVGPRLAQAPGEAPSAADVFEELLNEQGIEAAAARLRTMMAAEEGAYVFRPSALLRDLPRRLCREGRREDALVLMETLNERFGSSPRYWIELGDAYLMAGRGEKAEHALNRTVELIPGGHPILEVLHWKLDNLDDLLETTRLQRETEGRYQAGESTRLEGPYLGQEPPGQEPRVFAPGILSTTAHDYSIAFTPDGREIYFSRAGEGTMVCRWEEQGWTAPQVVSLVGGHVSEEPSVAPDGNTLLFNSRRNVDESRVIWRAERVGGEWGRPEELFPGMYATSTLEGVIYYTAHSGGIARAEPTEDGYAAPEVIGGGVNAERPDSHPFIAPDESYLLFFSERSRGAGLYVSFRLEDGAWGEAHSIDEILGIPPAGQPAMSPDGEYLFFCLCSDIYWVRADFLDELRPD